MKYLVDKIKLIKFLQGRPAMLDKVENIDEQFCMQLFTKESDRYNRYGNKFEDLYERLPVKFRTLKVTKAYIATNPYNFKLVPRDQLSQLDKASRMKMIKRYPLQIFELPNPTNDEWLEAMDQGYNIVDKIPEDVWTVDMYLAAIKGNSVNNLPNIPLEKWTEDLAKTLVTANKLCLESVPAHLITREVLALGVKQDLSRLTIPEAVWDRGLVEQAIEYQASNFFCVPRHLTNRADVIMAAKQGLDWMSLPDHDYELLVYYCSSKSLAFCGSGSEDDKKRCHARKFIKNDRKFILDVLAADGSLDVINRLGIEIPKDYWPDMIEAKPELIKSIEKIDQTVEMVSRFLMCATTEQKDQYDNHINLGKIREEDVPFLINCNSALLQETIKKHFKHDGKNQVTATTMEMSLAPSEFARLKGLLT